MSGVPATAIVYAAAAVALFGVGLWALAAHRHLLRRILALNILSSSAFLLLVAIARRAPDGPPDPLPHALALTGIVVAVSATALALMLLRRIHDLTGRATLPEDAHDA